MMDFQIEKILGKTQDSSGNIVYLVKWRGYPESDNTWEKKSDLIIDGLEKDILKYEREQQLQKTTPVIRRTPIKISPATTNTARSKTPTRRRRDDDDDFEQTSDNNNEDEKEEEEEEEEEEDGGHDSDDETDQEQDQDDSQASQSSSSTSVDLNGNISGSLSSTTTKNPDKVANGLRFSTLFALSVVLVVILKVMQPIITGEEKNKIMKFALMCVEPIPPLFCCLFILRESESTAYSRSIASALIWIVFGVVSETGWFNQNLDTMFGTKFVSMILTLVLFLRAITSDNVSSDSALLSALLASYLFVIIKLEMAVSNLALYVLLSYMVVRSISRVLNRKRSIPIMKKDNLSDLLDLLSSCLFLVLTAIDLLHEYGMIDLSNRKVYLSEQWPVNEALEINGLWLTKSALRWILCICLTIATLV